MKYFFLYCVITSAALILCSCESKDEPTAEHPDATLSAPVQMESQEKPAEYDLQLTNKPKPATQVFFDAALNGVLQTVESELNSGVNPNAVNSDMRTAMMLAAFNGHTNIVELMIVYGGHVNSLDGFGRTALMYAATGTTETTVKLLLEKGADVNIVDGNEKWTALMFAAAEGQGAIVKLLLEHGADWKLKDIDGDTAAAFAANNGHTQVVKIIQDYIKAHPAN